MAATASLAVRVSAQIAQFQAAFKEASKTLDKFADNFQSTATKASAIGTFIGNIFTKLASNIASGIGNAISDALRLSQEFNNAFLGLGSVASAFGQDVGEVTAAARRLSSDGLLPLRDSATGLKNLLAAGFNLEQSVQLMNAFKDSAAFGRQGALSFGDAVRSATEGVKNGNSILVDNAGVTKNLSVILKEAGLSAQDLGRASSDAGVRQALLNGILKETRAQLGDAQKLSLTYTGSITKLSTAYDGLLSRLGDTITQNKTVAAAITALSNVFQDFIIWLESHGPGAFNAVSDAVIAFVRILSGVVKAIDFVQVTFNNLDSVVRKVVKGLADAVSGIGGILVEIVTLASKLPGGTAAIGLAAREVSSLITVTTQAAAISKSMATEIAANDDRIKRWSGALGNASGFLDSLAINLQETRGQTVELGAATGKTTKGVADLGNSLGETDKKAKAAAEALKALQEKLSGQIAVNEAKKWELALASIGNDFSRLTDKDAKEFLGILDEITDRFGSLEAAGVGSLRNVGIALRALSQKGQTIDTGIIPTLSPQTLAQIVAKAQPPEMILPIIPELSDATLRSIGIRITNARIDWTERFKRFVDDLKDIGLFAARGLAETFGDAIRTGDWSQVENNLKLVLADALGNAAAAAVNLVVPGLGTALQPLFSALADKLLGFFGLGTRGRDMVKEFAASFGGFDDLREKLTTLGAEGERLWRTLTEGVGRNNPEQAQAAIDAITEAFKRAEQGLADFVTGAQKRIQAFASAFKTATGESVDDLRKLIEAEAPEFEIGITEANARKALDGFINVLGGSRTEIEAEFQRLGLFAGTAFAETLRDQGLAKALEAAGPLFEELTALGEEFGFSLEGSAAQFASFFEAARANQDVVTALEGITLMIRGAGDAAFLTQELFSAFTTDAITQFTRLTERGVAVNQVMAFMQPTLQALWEAQQRFGFETDDATQALINQAQQQGIVGAHMQDVNQKILDVLVAIAKVFRADIPAGLDATARAADTTARGMVDDFSSAKRRIQDELSGIDVKPIDVPVNFTFENRPDRFSGEFDFDVPALAGGGIVRSPTLALVGEAGPEAVVPLSQWGSMGRDTTVILEVDGRALGEVVVPHLPGGVTRLGLGF